MEYPLLLNGKESGKLRVEKQGLYTVMEAYAQGTEGLVRLWVQGGGEEAYLGVMQPWSGGLYLSRKLSRLEMLSFPQTIEQASDRRLEIKTVYITSERTTEQAAVEDEKKGEDGPKEIPVADNRAQEDTKAAYREAHLPEKICPTAEVYQPENLRTSEEAQLPEAVCTPKEACPIKEAGPPKKAHTPERTHQKEKAHPPEKAKSPEKEDRREREAEEGQETDGRELLWVARRDGSLVAKDGENYLVALPAQLRSVPPGARLRRIGGKEYLLFIY